MQNDNLAMLDLAHIWHPCTQMKDHEKLPIIPIKRAKGIYLYDFNDKSYIDCVSSWWVNLFGHCNDYINAAVKSQLDNLEHVILQLDLATSLLSIYLSGFVICYHSRLINAFMRIMDHLLLK